VAYGKAISTGKAAADTAYLLGGPGTNVGKFEDSTGTLPQRQGWSGVDWTEPTANFWHISDFNAANLHDYSGSTQETNLAMSCSEDLMASCGGSDPVGGYGNNYLSFLDWYGIVPDKTLATNVQVTGVINYDSENGWDFTRLMVSTATGWVAKISYTGRNSVLGVFPTPPLAINQSFTVNTADYVGSNKDTVHLAFRCNSDGNTSNDDCGWTGSGASQVDDLSVYFNTALQNFDDFQVGHTVHWDNTRLADGCGDFSKVWPRLNDADACRQNNTPQMAWIDDGVVVPGTGGSLGVSWTYGPSGFVVNSTGGLAGSGYFLNEEIWTPVLTWPGSAYSGATVFFNNYNHLPLSNGLFYYWNVRDSDDGGVNWNPWIGNNTVYYGSVAAYGRIGADVTPYLHGGLNRLQVSLGLFQWERYVSSHDYTPSPYQDYVSVVAYSVGGPAMVVRDFDRFQGSNFPEISTIDYGTLLNNSIRLDEADNIATATDPRNDPGDSMLITVTPVRAGSALNGNPVMHVTMKANPLFDGVRTLPLGWSQVGPIISGTVTGNQTMNGGSPVPNSFNWDLPDTGFFFPGDILHWYVRAEDNVGGNIGVSLFPGDTTGFSTFQGHINPTTLRTDYKSLRYPRDCEVRGLPTMHSAVAGDQPTMLFWNDQFGFGGDEEWMDALDHLGYREGTEYDYYQCNAPSSGLGNGLGGRAKIDHIQYYDTMLYTTGTMSSVTIANGDPAYDAGNDLALLNSWFALGGRKMFVTGNDLSYDLNKWANGQLFRSTYLGVTYNARTITSAIGGQYAPLVKPIAGNGIIDKYFVAYGGCTPIKNFNSVTVGSATKIAGYCDTGGNLAYPTLAAMTYNNYATQTAEIIYSPVDFQFWYNPAASQVKAPLPDGSIIRYTLLKEILLFFGHAPGGAAVGVPTPVAFSAKNYPNPFNPSTKIEFSLPVRGQVELKIYNVRGELVTTLLNETREAGLSSVVWNGTDSRGKTVASGVYFYSLKSGNFEKIEKMTLVK